MRVVTLSSVMAFLKAQNIFRQRITYQTKLSTPTQENWPNITWIGKTRCHIKCKHTVFLKDYIVKKKYRHRHNSRNLSLRSHKLNHDGHDVNVTWKQKYKISEEEKTTSTLFHSNMLVLFFKMSNVMHQKCSNSQVVCQARLSEKVTRTCVSFYTLTGHKWIL